MPATRIIQTNFTAGEISPRLLGHINSPRYPNALEKCRNAYPYVHGGATRRPGTRYVAEVKTSSKAVRLIPFIFSTTQAFILEFGDQYIRFYTNSGQVLDGGSPYEITSPYLESQLPDIGFVQSANTLYLVHPSHAPRKLVRYGNTNWKLSTLAFTVAPNDEIGDRPNTTLTLSGTSGSVTATAGAASFQNADVGRYIEIGAGYGKITAFTSTTVVTVTVQDNYASTGPHAANAWTLTESPKTTMTASVKDPVGATVTLTAGANAFKNDAQVTDIGKFISMNDGLIEITAVGSAIGATGIIRTVLNSTTAAPSEGWALRGKVWNAVDGYPSAVTLFEQRLVMANTPAKPQTIWGSMTGDYANFATGVDDDSAINFTLASDEVNPIRHIPSLRAILPLTYGGEFSMIGGIEKPLTPTNIRVRPQTSYGAATVRPVRVGDEVIYVQRSGRKLRSIGYRVETDSYGAPDISIMAEHITESGVKEMAYAQEPDSLVWMPRVDGKQATLTTSREQDVFGWGLQDTDGLFESVATIPNGAEDQVWCVINRTINGSTKRYVEYFQQGRNTDCCIIGTSGSPTKNWSGLNHLEGKTLDVLGDGSVLPQVTVSGGAVVLSEAVSSVELGLHYETRIKLLPPVVPSHPAGAQGSTVQCNEVIVRLYQTIGGKIDGETIDTFFHDSTLFDAAPAPFTGDIVIHKTDSANGVIELVQDQPLPFTVLAVVRKVVVND